MIEEEKDERFSKILLWFFICMLGVFLGYIWCYKALTKTYENRLFQYKEHYENIINSPEMDAINKCRENNGVWTAECLAWELNNRKR